MGNIKQKYKSLYWQQFLLSAGLVMLTLVLLGVSFFALSYNYTLSQRRDEMRTRADLDNLTGDFPHTCWRSQIEHAKKIGLGEDCYELVTI